ncbi:dienelactone hydrolase [Sandarakinorhabdus sp.]|uniref:alpha/beta hydrolase family protein n=1 Tax=Sandarakinorhabdus sp. TaxID=1916663 RepID=UPI00286DE589|nr:dienelactone hydrolase [Sandarakinorhabdus sp.]
MAGTALFTQPAQAAAPCDSIWRDPLRGRDIPVRIRLPAGKGKAAAVLWSPGLGGNSNGGEAWASAWAAAGMAVIQLQHPGSDSAVYAGAATPEDRARHVMAGASAAQLVQRTTDVTFIADELERGPRATACDTARIDTDRLGLAGHSMGAWTVQAIAGQRLGPGFVFADRRFRAFIAFSPNARPGSEAQFADIGRPFLSVTGTMDGAPLSADPARRASALADRIGVFKALPADGRKALLVFGGADHMMFAGNPGRARSDAAAARVHAASAAVTTAWWQYWLLNEKAAAEPVLKKPPLAPGDDWERK